jgi:hypothetical protein
MNKGLYYTIVIFSFFWSEILAIYLSFLQLSTEQENTNIEVVNIFLLNINMRTFD